MDSANSSKKQHCTDQHMLFHIRSTYQDKNYMIVMLSCCATFLYQDHNSDVHQSNTIDDAMNDVIMVIDHQQKGRLFLYNICSIYFYIHFLLGYVWATTGIIGYLGCLPPACDTFTRMYPQRSKELRGKPS